MDGDEDDDGTSIDDVDMLLHDPRLAMSRITYDLDRLTNLAICDAIEDGRASHPDELEPFWHPGEVAGVPTTLTLVRKGFA